MATTGRYFYTPAKIGRVYRRLTLADRFRIWKSRRNQQVPDVFLTTGYNRPVLPAGSRGRLE